MLDLAAQAAQALTVAATDVALFVVGTVTAVVTSPVLLVGAALSALAAGAAAAWNGRTAA